MKPTDLLTMAAEARHNGQTATEGRLGMGDRLEISLTAITVR